MRDARTDNATFRAALHELTLMLVYEATARRPAAHRAACTRRSRAPRATAWRTRRCWCRCCGPGSGMADEAQALIPDAQMGFVGMARDEETHQPTPYMESLPESLAGRPVFVLDPMLATGGSMVHTIRLLDRARRDRRDRGLRARRPRGRRPPARQRPAGPPGHGERRRAAQRLGLHRARASATRATVSSAPSGRFELRYPLSATALIRSSVSRIPRSSSSHAPAGQRVGRVAGFRAGATTRGRGGRPQRGRHRRGVDSLAESTTVVARCSRRRGTQDRRGRRPTTARRPAARAEHDVGEVRVGDAPRRGGEPERDVVLHRVRADRQASSRAPRGRTPPRVVRRADPACRRTA